MERALTCKSSSTSRSAHNEAQRVGDPHPVVGPADRPQGLQLTHESPSSSTVISVRNLQVKHPSMLASPRGDLGQAMRPSDTKKSQVGRPVPLASVRNAVLTLCMMENLGL